MSEAIGTVRRVFGIGLAWTLVWGALWAIVAVIVMMVDPASVDPGEGQAAILVLGSMGVFTGLVFGFLVSTGGRVVTALEPTLLRALSWGLVGSAVVQVGYLHHGDAGLVANLGMALLLCVFGGLTTSAWLVGTRWWCNRRRVHSLHA